MALKVDVHEVEETTKIRAKYLRALENEEYNLLPGPAYVKSFLRTYADYLGLDSRRLIDLYKRQSNHLDEEPAGFGLRADRSRGPTALRNRWMIVVLAVAILLVLLFVIGSVDGGTGGGS